MGKQSAKSFYLRLGALLFFSTLAHADGMYVGIYANNAIEKFDQNGVGSVFASGSSGLHSPRGLAFDGSGNLYVANGGSSNLRS